MCSDTEERWKICRGIDLSFQNSHNEFGEFWPEHSKVSNIFNLIGSFWAKYILFEQRSIVESTEKYRGVIFHDIEKRYKIWRKTDFWFGKLHEEFCKFSPELWWDAFIQSRKCLSLKFTEELCAIKMKNDAILGEDSTCCSKLDMRNLTNVDPNTQKSQKIALSWALFDQIIPTFELKKYRGIMFDSTEDWCKVWRKTDLCFQKWQKFGKFSQDIKQKFHFRK